MDIQVSKKQRRPSADVTRVLDRVGDVVLYDRVVDGKYAFWCCRCDEGHTFRVRTSHAKERGVVKCPECRGGHSQCPRCGEVYRRYVLSVVCCLFAPEATGWCAWCGDDCGERVFCDTKCARAYGEGT